MEEREKLKIPTIHVVFMILGPMLLIGGIVMFIFGMTTDIFALCPVGGFSIPAGAGLTFWGFMPLLHKATIKTQKYILDQNQEELKDISSTSADISSEAITKVTSAVRKGLETPEKTKNFCSNCGAKIEANENFCSHCGSKIER